MNRDFFRVREIKYSWVALSLLGLGESEMAGDPPKMFGKYRLKGDE